MDLDVNNIVGQCYDGASVMCGTYKSVAARLVQIVPTALYVHCNGHILNLCLIDVAQAVSLYNLIEASAKRHKIFEEIQKDAGLASLSLKQLCDTRWTCRHESLKVIVSRYTEIILALEEIEVGDAFIMLPVIRTFDFIFHIHLMSEMFLLTNILSKYLQKSDVSLIQALVQVKATVDSLESLRNENEFDRIWNTTVDLCDINNIDGPCERRKRKVSIRLGDGDVVSTALAIKDSYRINSFYAVLDFYGMNYEQLRTEQRMYKVTLGEKVQLTLTLLSLL
ncbi:unnamed protein product [Rotaria sp. Silwood1]|nr:unnamed protein product [Rotaria sp. Silwood1]CAF1687203.1 unnamed protein product [Rotaria sp. Silwood1]CAF3590933.1 unnamed protein product [Rotaria sp. Silwood1]CAF3610167.1 unnamed protein product [Rotaria sp. Silwood1]CAF4876281.1 unnamed protein product [Rotaria sp. Silwood1]